MGWAAASRNQIAGALGYPLVQAYLLSIDAAMVSVGNTGQQSIDYVEQLLAQWVTADAAVAAGAGSAGLIQADVLHWSDKNGGRNVGLNDRLYLVMQRISNALGLPVMGGAGISSSGICAMRSTRS